MTTSPRMPMPVIPSNLGQPGGPRFLDVLNYHLGAKLQKFVHHSLTKTTMEQMYACIKETVESVFSKGSQNVNEITRRWLAQKFYETIKIGDSSIITREEDTWKYGVNKVYESVNLTTAPDSDVRLIAGLFNEATFANDIRDELKRRGLR